MHIVQWIVFTSYEETRKEEQYATWNTKKGYNVFFNLDEKLIYVG